MLGGCCPCDAGRFCILDFASGQFDWKSQGVVLDVSPTKQGIKHCMSDLNLSPVQRNEGQSLSNVLGGCCPCVGGRFCILDFASGQFDWKSQGVVLDFSPTKEGVEHCVSD